jgi:hypothetical protein
MRRLVLAALLLPGCIVYERRVYTPPPESQGVQERAISEQEAVDAAFRLCQDRSLFVDRVERTELDRAGRWHVTLVGYLDRAQMLLDGRDGKLLKGRFKKGDALAPGAPISPPSAPSSAPSPGVEPPAAPATPPPPPGADELD